MAPWGTQAAPGLHHSLALLGHVTGRTLRRCRRIVGRRPLSCSTRLACLQMPHDLANPESLPQNVVAELRSVSKALWRAEYIDQLLEHVPLVRVAHMLNEHCIRDGVVGYHYTRGLRASFEQFGLQPQMGRQRRSQFLEEHGHRFTGAQRQRLIDGWAQHFTKAQDSERDGRIWFALTDKELRGTGAASLLRYYGGEALYFPFIDDTEISTILRSIGCPLLVTCRLSTDHITTFTSIPWGKVWLSTIHCATNPDAHRHDIDAYCMHPVPPEDLLEIREI